MKKNIVIRAFYCLLFILAFTGCKAQKALVSQTVLATPSMPLAPDTGRKDKLRAINEHDLVFNTLAIKSKAVLSIDDKRNDLNMNFRIKANEVIWVSVTAIAGLEVARALITPDSVKILNRIDNIYLKKPFSYIYEFTNEQINFKTLQSLFIGNTIPEFITDSTELNLENEEATLISKVGSLRYDLRVGKQNKVFGVNFSDEQKNQELNVNYSDFFMINEQSISHSIIMNSNVKSKTFMLDLRFLKVDLDGPLELPFRVPERFLIKN